MTDAAPPAGRLDLTLDRFVAAPLANVWRAWTEPELIKQWFTPRPWLTVDCIIDLRPGGRFFTRMRGPDGTEHPNDGVFLEVVPQQRLVFTDTLLPGWRPAPKPFFTAILSFAAKDGGTQYRAQALHKDDADREAHEKMGFHDGWATAAQQMEELAASLGGGTR